MCHALCAGTARLQIGKTTKSTSAATAYATQTACGGNRGRRVEAVCSGRKAVGMSRFNGAPSQCEQSLRPFLDEEDDEDQHGDLREHRALPRLEELVDDAQAERRVDGAR